MISNADYNKWDTAYYLRPLVLKHPRLSALVIIFCMKSIQSEIC